MIADRMIKALGVFATCAFAFALPASAADSEIVNGFYVEYTAGASYVPNQNLTNADASGTDASGDGFSGRAENNVGFVVGGAFGARLYEHFRVELQYSYRQSEVNHINIQGEKPDHSDGSFGLMTVMTNGYFDYDLGIGVIPYVGAGIGWGRIELDAKNHGQPEAVSVEGEDSVFAWNLMVGGSYPLNEAVDISLGYRYVATTDPELNASLTVIGVSPVERRARRLDSEYDAHEGVFALRFKF